MSYTMMGSLATRGDQPLTRSSQARFVTQISAKVKRKISSAEQDFSFVF
jgi:hypothetical protein